MPQNFFGVYDQHNKLNFFFIKKFQKTKNRKQKKETKSRKTTTGPLALEKTRKNRFREILSRFYDFTDSSV